MNTALSIMETINMGLSKAFSQRVANIDMHKDGEEIATVQQGDGTLEIIMVKLLPKEMREEFTGEVRNIYK